MNHCYCCCFAHDLFFVKANRCGDLTQSTNHGRGLEGLQAMIGWELGDQLFVGEVNTRRISSANTILVWGHVRYRKNLQRTKDPGGGRFLPPWRGYITGAGLAMVSR